MKSRWLDNQVHVNVAACHIDCDDHQLTTVLRAATVRGQDRTFTILQNTGKSSISSVKLELGIDVTDFWNVHLAYALTDSNIDSFIQSVDTGADARSAFKEAALIFGYQPSGDVLISGTQLPQVSRHQLNLSNTFSGELTTDLDWFLHIDFNYNAKRYAQIYNLAHTGSRELLNLRAGLRSERFDLELWANNLLDNKTSPALIRYVEANPGTNNPVARAIGLTARYRF